jgi:hypothetical protein
MKEREDDMENTLFVSAIYLNPRYNVLHDDTKKSFCCEGAN